MALDGNRIFPASSRRELEKQWIVDDEGAIQLGYSDGERVFYVVGPKQDPSNDYVMELLESIRRVNNVVQ